eukprot:6173329-Pleurochrysis_carterae.AAC.1
MMQPEQHKFQNRLCAQPGARGAPHIKCGRGTQSQAARHVHADPRIGAKSHTLSSPSIPLPLTSSLTQSIARAYLCVHPFALVHIHRSSSAHAVARPPKPCVALACLRNASTLLVSFARITSAVGDHQPFSRLGHVC